MGFGSHPDVLAVLLVLAAVWARGVVAEKWSMKR